MKRMKEKLQQAKDAEVLSLIEVKCAVGARVDLGRPKNHTEREQGSIPFFVVIFN